MNIFKRPIFISVVFFKFILAYLFSSQYNLDLFIPFINSLSFDNMNPWQAYYNNGIFDAFPYHGLMLYLLAPFVNFGDFIGLSSLFLKLPLLIADIGVLIVLLKLIPNNENKILIYYFLNPIIIYGTYIHSQLDIIPTALLFCSIYFLTTQKILKSSIFFGLAIATKIHVLIALPLIAFFLFKKYSWLSIPKYFATSFSLVLLFDLPFIFSDGFFYMVLVNSKQSLLFDTFFEVGSLKFLFPIVIISLVYLHFFNQNKINHDLLFFYLGILFTLLIFFIYPSPAWYIWMIPFVCVYFIKNKNQNKSLILYALFGFSYIIFFIFFYISEYKDIYFLQEEINLKSNNEKLRNLSFTILQISLLAMMYAFYRYGIKSNSIYKKKTNLSIGIGGDSGTGKSKLLSGLKNILGEKVLTIEGDAEHKWERGDANWDRFTHLDPKANYVHKQANAIFQLKQNQSIFRNKYDHRTGKFTKQELVEPREFIIIAGLHPFYMPKLRKNIDLKIYLDTEEKLRKYWKILRDTSERQYSKEKIIKQIDERTNDSKKYIYPQKQFADMEISFFSLKDFDPNLENLDLEIGVKITLSANIYIEDLLGKLSSEFVLWDYNDDLNSQYLKFTKEPLNDFKILADKTIENINEVIDQKAKWGKGYEGLLQYLCLKMICEKLKDD